jgi:phage-related protein
MPTFSVSYDVADVYKVVTDLFYSFWPLISIAIGLALAVMLFGGIITVFRRWLGHE